MKEEKKDITAIITDIEKEIQKIDMERDAILNKTLSSDELYIVASNYYDVYEKLNKIKNIYKNMSIDLAIRIDELIRRVDKDKIKTEQLAQDYEKNIDDYGHGSY